MKKLTIALIVAIFAIQAVSAQEETHQKMTPQQRTEMRIKKMDERMTLTDDQKTQIRTLYADFNKQKHPRDQRKAAMEKLIADIEVVLTPEQQKIYKQMREEAKKDKKNASRKTK